jgi:hypothetical protein
MEIVPGRKEPMCNPWSLTIPPYKGLKKRRNGEMLGHISAPKKSVT